MNRMTYIALVGASLIAAPLPAMGADAEDVQLGDSVTSGNGDRQIGEIPDVARTPSPAGPVPIPYPNIGSTRTPPGPAELAGEPTDTQTDSTVPELGGIVVLCNNQSDDQNACEPRDGPTSDGEANIRFGDGIRGARPAVTSGGDDSETRVPETLRHRDR